VHTGGLQRADDAVRRFACDVAVHQVAGGVERCTRDAGDVGDALPVQQQLHRRVGVFRWQQQTNVDQACHGRGGYPCDREC